MITPGTRIGPYEVTGSLGAGGMGEVYRARDAKLKRDVALKILPDAFANDPDRLARFQREAQVLASLNHPHIAAIYGLEEGPAETGPHVRALVMELVEGEDLAQRLSRGPVPIDEALPIARQIADALEAAHEQGIIHRDLKPANIKVRPDGTVKVLDFGLAKIAEAQVSGLTAQGLTQSPTITSPAMTHAGMILGTAAYMSPEQAKGRPADKRSDVWSFGCVLYEMLAGRRPFVGEDVADTLAHILTKEPDWAVLPASTPAAMRRLLRRCLQRDRKLRLDSAAAARLEIDEALAPPSSADRPAPIDSSLANRGSRRATMGVALAWGVAVAALIGASVLLVLWAPWRTAPEPARLAFEIQTGNAGGGQIGRMMIAVSPDGTHVATRVLDGTVTKLFVRPLAQVEGMILARTDGAAYPYWSPDGRSVGFIADGKLKTIDIRDGAPQTLADAALGGTWSREGVILFSPGNAGPLFRVAATGGPAAPVTELDITRGDTSHRFPRFLPDGVHFLFLIRSTRQETGGIYLGSLTSKETHRLVDAVSKPEFAPPDLLLFARESALMAQRLDVGSAQMLGAPFRVVEPVGSTANTGAGAFSVSDNGVLAYRAGTGGDTVELVWVDRHGKRENVVGRAGGYQNPRLSPDGRRLASYKSDGGGDIWITELDRGTSTRFTLDPATDNVPLWSPNGQRIAFVSNRDGGVFNIYQKNAGGTGPEELLLKTPNLKLLNDWSPDGRYLVYQEVEPQTKTDLWMLPLDGNRKPSRFIATAFNESEATFSPDGRWIAYVSDESGSRQVYVQRFPTGDGKWQVSNTRVAAHPRWGVDGKELFFDAGGTMHAVTTPAAGAGNDFTPGAPVPLFQGLLDLSPHNFDVTRDGRFLVVLAQGAVTESAPTPPITIIVNWTSGLSQGR